MVSWEGEKNRSVVLPCEENAVKREGADVTGTPSLFYQVVVRSQDVPDGPLHLFKRVPPVVFLPPRTTQTPPALLFGVPALLFGLPKARTDQHCCLEYQNVRVFGTPNSNSGEVRGRNRMGRRSDWSNAVTISAEKVSQSCGSVSDWSNALTISREKVEKSSNPLTISQEKVTKSCGSVSDLSNPLTISREKVTQHCGSEYRFVKRRDDFARKSRKIVKPFDDFARKSRLTLRIGGPICQTL